MLTGSSCFLVCARNLKCHFRHMLFDRGIDDKVPTKRRALSKKRFGYSYFPSFILIFISYVAHVSNCSLQYTAPNDCKWSQLSTSTDVSVKCYLETIISSGVLATNFSLLQAEHTTMLSVECEPLLFESTLSPSSFYHLRFLKSLSFTRCKLRELPSDAFFGLEQLKNLTIRTHNEEWNLILDPESFSDLRSLEYLDLGNNKINKITHGVLCGLTSLKTLNLTHNDLVELFSGEGNQTDSSRCLEDLLELDISYNRFVTLNYASLKNFSKLRVLNLRNNFFRSLESSAFIHFSKLQVLELSHNLLEIMQSSLFVGTSDLRELHLQNNSLSSLPVGLFSGLQQLVVLDMSHNHITSDSITSDTFIDLIRLVILRIEHNKLQRIDNSTFQSQYSLQMLFLSHNMISEISGNSFSSLYNLHTLDLGYNNLKYVDVFTLNGLYVMNSLCLSNNHIFNIHSDAFKNCSSVQNLDLNSNSLGNVPEYLKSLQFLKNLNLANNSINSVSNSSFQYFEQLSVLDLSRNHIKNLTRSSFVGMSSLQTLILSNNELYHIEHGAFDELQTLAEIDLSYNFLPDINGLFMNLKKLEILNVSRNKISWFDFALIPTNLQTLDLHSNAVDALGNYYELESTLTLRFLDASYNRIKEVNEASFPNHLRVLNLSHNHISIVSPFTFMAKVNLTVVNIARNQLKSLDINAFRLNPQVFRSPLPEFYVSGNPYFCDCNMEWLQHMNRLDGTTLYPRIADIDDVTCELSFKRHHSIILLIKSKSSDFLCSYRSHCFALCHCCEFDACDCEMVCPENCTCYSDQTWNTNVVDCSRREFNSMPSVIPMDVTDLYLDGNDIRQLSSHTFIGRKNMKVAFLNDSHIHAINNRTFNGLLSLRILHLENNELTILHGFEFETLVLLKELYLSNNKIRNVANNTFQNLKSLQVLHLDRNMIVEFQVWNLNWNPHLIRVNLGNNPYTCKCQYLESYIEWLHSVSSTVLLDTESIRCTQGNKSALLYTLEFDLCSNYSDITYFQAVFQADYLPMTIIATSLSLLMLLLLILMCIYRRDLKIWLHSKFGLRLFERNHFTPESEKLFDAFVSYCKKDENFVSQLLAPELECGAPSYRLCLRYRDLPLSGYVTDAITEAIECSHRTIIVLSEQFLRSDWCRFELKSCHRESQCNTNHKLIVVVLDNLSLKLVDSDTKMCFRNAPIVRWSDKRFWEKLRYSMPNGQRQQQHTTTIDPKISRQRFSFSNSIKLV